MVLWFIQPIKAPRSHVPLCNTLPVLGLSYIVYTDNVRDSRYQYYWNYLFPVGCRYRRTCNSRGKELSCQIHYWPTANDNHNNNHDYNNNNNDTNNNYNNNNYNNYTNNNYNNKYNNYSYNRLIENKYFIENVYVYS